MKLIQTAESAAAKMLLITGVTDDDAAVLRAAGLTHEIEKEVKLYKKYPNLVKDGTELWEQAKIFVVDLGFTKLVAEAGNPEPGIKEVYLGFETNGDYQDIVAISNASSILPESGRCDDGEVMAYVWADEQTEDYTNRFRIKQYIFDGTEED